MNLIYITDEPQVAKLVAAAGVDYVMVDLEINGKHERQGHLNTVISNHRMQSVAIISKALEGSNSRTLVRLNPVYDQSVDEVDHAIAGGASKLMLPMFRRSDDVEYFLSLVNNRIPVTLLVETAAAYARLPKILEINGNYDIHIGLNDLHLEMNLDFMFELFIKDGVVDHISRLCKTFNRKFGIGGVSRLNGEGALPAEDILSEHLRFGSSSVILSRDWRKSIELGDFPSQILSLRKFLLSRPSRDPAIISENISNIVKHNFTLR